MDYAAYEADRKKLAARIVAVRQIIQDTTDPQERIRQTERLRILQGMYRDTLDNLERLRPPQEKHRKEQRRKISLDAFSWDFLERTKTTFADLEGTTWQAAEAGGLTAKQAAALQKVLQRAVEKLSDRQHTYFFAHMEGQTIAQIAESHGRPGGEDLVPHHLCSRFRGRVHFPGRCGPAAAGHPGQSAHPPPAGNAVLPADRRGQHPGDQ